MIELDGGIELPYPKGATCPFVRDSWIGETRMSKRRPEMWQRAYTHCLHFLHTCFDSPMHSVCGWMGKNMEEVVDGRGQKVALRFLGEMRMQGYIRLVARSKDFSEEWERIIQPTQKLLKLRIVEIEPPMSVCILPDIVNETRLHSHLKIKGGVKTIANKRKVNVVKDMAKEQFTINKYIYNLVEEYGIPLDDYEKDCMYNRTLHSARMLADRTFRFPYFLCSRGRAYITTTCGISPQGADHERAILEPVFCQKLTTGGINALIEAAHGYSEIPFPVDIMIAHATYPDKYRHEWKLADKPYCYMACCRLLMLHKLDPERPLPAFTPLDGRCSGLQHWSALLRSNVITSHIGMEVEEAKLDIYEQVAHNWEPTLEAEYKFLAYRKVAKIPTMTWGYNAMPVTSGEWIYKLHGAKSSWDAVEEKYVYSEGISKKECYRLGRELYGSLQSTLGSLSVAVKWLSDCAAIITESGSPEIHWMAPDGFECMQRKVMGVPVTIAVKLSNGDVMRLGLLDFSDNIPNTHGAKLALAPNIIHSLDACHLRMVARKLVELGDPMIFVHDSFSTHSNFRSTLYKIIVETFIQLYNMDYLKELKEYWEWTYKVALPEPPQQGLWRPNILSECDAFFK
jgi:DNA-directed RNA polymerase